MPLAGTVFIWRALFESRGADIRGYDFGQIVYYFLVVLLVENLVTPTDDEWQIAAEIREGQINNFLSKPIDHLAYRGSLFLSARLLYTAVTILPIAGVFAWFHEFIVLPRDPLTWPLFLVSLVMAGAIQFLIAYALAMLAFWILEISTVVFILYSFEYYLSGRMFPLDVMPDGIAHRLEVPAIHLRALLPRCDIYGKDQRSGSLDRPRYSGGMGGRLLSGGKADVARRAAPLRIGRGLASRTKESDLLRPV